MAHQRHPRPASPEPTTDDFDPARDAQADEADEESFPASDPPAGWQGPPD
jgi:hypothetical protein